MVLKTEGYVIPFLDFVPLWRFYPDMSVNALAGCRYVGERHLMTKQEMVELSRRKELQWRRPGGPSSEPDGRRENRTTDEELNHGRPEDGQDHQHRHLRVWSGEDGSGRPGCASA